jgi:hypothetical protein
LLGSQKVIHNNPTISEFVFDIIIFHFSKNRFIVSLIHHGYEDIGTRN